MAQQSRGTGGMALGPAPGRLQQDSWEQPPLPHSQAGERMLCTSASQAATFRAPFLLKSLWRTLGSHSPEAHSPVLTQGQTHEGVPK